MAFMNPIAQRRRMSMMQGPQSDRQMLSPELGQRRGVYNPAGSGYNPSLDTPNQLDAPMRPQASPQESTMSDRYRQMLGEAPSREDYSPSKMTRLSAALGGISEGWHGGAGAGFNTARGINESGYRQAMEDYQGNLERTGSSARMEMEDERYQIEIAIQAQEMGLTVAEFEEKMRSNRAGEASTDRGLAIREQEASDSWNLGNRRATTAEGVADNTRSYQEGILEQGGARLGQGRDRLDLDENRLTELQSMNKARIRQADERLSQQAEEDGVDPNQYMTILSQVNREMSLDSDYGDLMESSNPDFPEISGDLDEEELNWILAEREDRIRALIDKIRGY